MICLNVYFSLSNVSLYFTSSIIEWNSCEKLWEIRQQEYLLTIAYHINRICRKASQKLHALFGTAKKIPEDKKCILFKFSIISRLTKNVSAQKMKSSIKDFFSKCDQIRRKLRIWLLFLKKSLLENFIFCGMCPILWLCQSRDLHGEVKHLHDLALTLSCKILKNGQIYFENLKIF